MHQMKPNREDHFGKFFRPTEEEPQAMGIKKYPEAPKVVKVCRPKHYGARACVWITEWVSERTYEVYSEKYPTMEVVEDKRRKKSE